MGVRRWLLGMAVCGACVEVAEDPDAAAWALEEAAPITDEVGDTPNILLVVLDDVGPELVDTYGLDALAAPTPTLDALAEEGVMFTRAWAMPWCSPTRAALATGVFPGRLGLGRAIEITRSAGEEWSFPIDLWTVMDGLRDAPSSYGSGLAGKWHLTTWADGAHTAALDAGFDHHFGSAANPQANHGLEEIRQNHWRWERLEDGELSTDRRHTIVADATDALALMATLEPPWFVQVGMRAAHFPYDQPPDAMHDYGLVRGEPVWATRAMVQASDRALGAVLDAMPPEVRAHTVVIVMGDNGTTKSARAGTYKDALGGKSTVYEGGVRVPLVIAGPGIDGGRVDDSLVHVLDLVPTMLDVAGVDREDWPDLDGVSLWPHLVDPAVPTARRYLYTEAWDHRKEGEDAAGDRALWDGEHKRVVVGDQRVETYRVGEDPLELPTVRPLRHLAERMDDPKLRYRAF